MNESTEPRHTYRVCIEETIAQEFEIEADSVEEALEKARSGYRGGELVLEAGELHYVQMRSVTPSSSEDGAADAWEEI